MTRPAPQRERRAGVTLLEVITAVSLSATLMASSFVVLRSSYAAWQAHESDLDAAESAAAVLRHLRQHARQAVAVRSISSAADSSGHLAIERADGSTLRWDHSGTQVTLQVDATSPQPLADGVVSLTLEGYEADGVTATTEPSDVQTFRTTVTASLPDGGARTVSSFTWVRAW
ncbi:hypothetical protein MalM25_15090 [Planctomycetes bacterium MalM25]|nr:hypothetical protein MalM25_15090 [Planctomycetes bacterium MalM25]